MGLDTNQKRLELLKETIPAILRVAVLQNPTNPVHLSSLKATEEAAQVIGLHVQTLEVRDPSEFSSAFVAMTSERADALVVLGDPLFLSHRREIAALAVMNRLPTVHGERAHAEAGALMSYGTSAPDLWRRAATYVDKILKGAKPADLPVEQPTKFELVINLKTANALGLTIPPTLLFRADEVIR
jgi:putative ABC transport system substrate-binding protein